MRKQYEDTSRNSSVEDDNDELKLGKEFDDEKLKHTCTICGHAFKSKKAVHGHMKTHPERGWRGMKEVPAAAPASATAHRSSASSSSSGGGVVVEKNYGGRSLLWSWNVTAKRGRKCINIASTASASACSASNYSAVFDTEIREKDIDDPPHHQNIWSSKRKIDKLSDTFEKITKGEMKVEIDEYLENKNKNKKKKNVILRKEYHCDMCDKTFLSPQALGGHKSSHYKPNKTEPPQLSITQSDQMPRPKKMLDFDLNDLPPSPHDDGEGSQFSNYFS